MVEVFILLFLFAFFSCSFFLGFFSYGFSICTDGFPAFQSFFSSFENFFSFVLLVEILTFFKAFH